MAEYFNLLMDCNVNDPNKTPKIWACDNKGNLFFGSIEKNYTHQSKAPNYRIINQSKKVNDGYDFIGTVTEDELGFIKSIYSNNLSTAMVNQIALMIDAQRKNPDPNRTGDLESTLKGVEMRINQRAPAKIGRFDFNLNEIMNNANSLSSGQAPAMNNANPAPQSKKPNSFKFSVKKSQLEAMKAEGEAPDFAF